MTYDYIIVGAGSAGCVLANRLSANPATRVLLLEAGGSDWHPFIHMPAGLAKLVGKKGVNWDYSTEPEPNLAGRRPRIESLRVAGLAGLQLGVHVNFEEALSREERSDPRPILPIGGDKGKEHDVAGLEEEPRHLPRAPQVLTAVSLGEAEVAAETVAQLVTVQQRDPAPQLEETPFESPRDRALPRPG